MKPMTLNLSKMKKIAGDKKTSTFQHDNGHEITIMHSALPALQRKQIEKLPVTKMAGGGDVQGSTGPSDGSQKPVPQQQTSGTGVDPTKLQQFKNGSGFYKDGGDILADSSPQVLAQNEDPTTDIQAQTPIQEDPNAKYQNMAQQYEDYGHRNNVNATPLQIENTAAELAASQKNQDQAMANVSQIQGQDNMQFAKNQLDQTNNNRLAIGLQPLDSSEAGLGSPNDDSSPVSAVDKNQIQGNTGPQGTPLGGLAGPQNQGSQTPGGYNYQDLINQGQQSIELNKQAAIMEAQQKAQALSDFQRLSQRSEEIYQDGIQNKQIDIDNAIKDIKDGTINPSHYVENMSVPAKVSTAVGLVLGGFASAYNHNGRNPAMDFLNSQIDRDIASQQANLDKKKTLLGAYQAQYGNMQAAQSMTKATLMGNLATQFEQAGNNAATPQAKAAAIMASTQLKAGILQSINQAQIAQQGVTTGLTPQQFSRVPANDQGNYAKGPNNMMYNVGSKEAAQKVSDNEVAFTPLMQDLNRLDTLNTLSAKSGLPTPQRAEAETLKNRITQELMDMSKSKRISEESLGFQQGQFSDPTSLKEYLSKGAGTTTLKKSLTNAREAVLGQYLPGYTPQQNAYNPAPQNKSYVGAPLINPRTGEKYQVSANGTAQKTGSSGYASR